MNLPVIDSAAETTKTPVDDPRRHLLDVSEDELKQWLADHGQPTFRAKQIIQWVFQRRVTDFQQMSDLPKSLREELIESFRVLVTHQAAEVRSRDGTDKLLVRVMSRLVAPNSAETYAAFAPHLRAALERSNPGAQVTLTHHQADPRAPFAVMAGLS